ncbi:helix-turn-helix domain containing protein [Rhizobium sp. 32-5/1]|uniref:TetR/AcrR family transcriptional regulator n=1 Tax=Rhizobium sp. 32-5/1 TaxID=3019602 RepID=UPI00240D9468|nr:TetR/AcrR family transcriptional regulator [Rhizobium sp. 32-5/1]WEZ81850.1 helix-turn-helix domain containing protein [Rhizobium sp. 32-5/1]
MRRSNSERSENMRAALIEAGRRLFVENGYAETGTPDIVAAAGVTRGALYHHFEDKKALFAAVVADEARRTAAQIEAASEKSGNARDALLDGTRAYFDAMAVPGRTRLLLLNAPAVLGAELAGQVDRERSEMSLKMGLAAVFAENAVNADLLEVFTTLVSAAFDRAALAIEAGGVRADYEKAIAALIDGIAVK